MSNGIDADLLSDDDLEEGHRNEEIPYDGPYCDLDLFSSRSNSANEDEEDLIRPSLGASSKTPIPVTKISQYLFYRKQEEVEKQKLLQHLIAKRRNKREAVTRYFLEKSTSDYT